MSKALRSLKLGKPEAKFRHTVKFKAPICRDGESRNGGHKARRIIRKGK